MVGVAARTKVRDQGNKGRSRSSDVHPITVAISLALILLTITAILHIVPTLLHPLFGSIPVNVYKEPTINGLFGLSAVLLVSLPQILDPDMVILAGLNGLDLVVLATAYKKAARLGGHWFGAIGGATGALVVLCLGPILLGAIIWSRIMESVWTRNGTTRKGKQGRIFVLATTTLLWLGVQLALLCIRSHAGSELMSQLVTIFRPEVRHPLFVIIGLSGIWLLQSWLEARRIRPRPGNPFNSTLHLLTLFLIGNVALSLVRPRALPYTVALPPDLTSPVGAPKDRPSPGIRILNSTRSITGQIVVAENVEYGYRFLRCDHSLLGGRWAREGRDGQTEFGDSIFSTFVLQDAAKLVYRSELYHPKAKLSAEIIGLGVGIAAHSLMIDGVSVRITEIDPAVYEAAHDYFGLPAPARLELDDGAKVVENRATAIRTSGRPLHPREQTDYVVHDCFTGGSVPAELFTREFWWDLTMSMKTDGVLVVNFAGILQSRASQAVFATLLDVFPQCRAFQDVYGIPENATGKELINMVIFCTMVHSPLLTFRVPEPRDLGYSPLRQEVLTTFLPHETSIADQLGTSTWQSFWIDDVDGYNDRSEHEDQNEDEDDGEGEYYRPDPNNTPEMKSRKGERDLILRRGRGMDQLDKWQVDSAVATWIAMRTIMPVEGWMAY